MTSFLEEYLRCCVDEDVQKDKDRRRQLEHLDRVRAARLSFVRKLRLLGCPDRAITRILGLPANVIREKREQYGLSSVPVTGHPTKKTSWDRVNLEVVRQVQEDLRQKVAILDEIYAPGVDIDDLPVMD